MSAKIVDKGDVQTSGLRCAQCTHISLHIGDGVYVLSAGLPSVFLPLDKFRPINVEMYANPSRQFFADAFLATYPPL